jgi:propanol-preferring alcohol dehydrogenase
MKAALLKEFGKPLVIEDVPVPEPGAGQVLLKVAACGVCHSDVHIAHGEWEGFKPRMPMPVVLGQAVQRLKEGDTVGVPWFHSTCGDCNYCRQDQEVFCDRSEVTGVTVHGGFAEYMIAWDDHVVAIPQSLPLELAAPLFCAGGTVYSALSKVRLDDSVRLGVWGAGGLGHYGIQLGKAAESHVTAIDLLPEKLAAAKDIGADVALSSEAAAAWFANPANRVDVALVCATSAEAYQAAFAGLKKNGVMLVVGIPSKPLSWMAGDLIRSGVRVVPSRVASRAELRALVRLAASGSIHSEVRTYPLEMINEVMNNLANGRIFGRSVIALT